MTKHKALVATLCLAAAGGSWLLPGVSAAAVGIDIDIAPPAPRVEVVPPPRAGYVWAPGYWAWRGGVHAWVPGRWVVARRGYHWVPDRWVRVGPHWHYARGYWAR